MDKKAQSYNFETFTGRSAHIIETPYVSFMSNGAKITLNNAAYVALGKAEYVELLFDRERSAVGIRASTKNTNHAYKVQKHGSANSFTVTALAFIEYAGIGYALSRRYAADVVGGILVIELKGKFEEVNRRSPRMTKQKEEPQ